MEDENGIDCCDKVRSMVMKDKDYFYNDINILRKKACIINPRLRTKFNKKAGYI